jgi:hypothetical protein
MWRVGFGLDQDRSWCVSVRWIMTSGRSTWLEERSVWTGSWILIGCIAGLGLCFFVFLQKYMELGHLSKTTNFMATIMT